jgi:hypothetical protein
MQAHPGPRSRTIHSYIGPRALSSQTRRSLSALGYSIVPGSTVTVDGQGLQEPALRLVDERHLASAPTPECDPDTPIILLTGKRARACEDPRIVDHIRRPAQLNDIFRGFQSALETHPRRVPRVATQLAARCIRSHHNSFGAVMSLSEGGCLIATSELIGKGAQMSLQLAIPKDGIITTPAECVYQHENRAGLAFSDTSDRNRQVINDFVASRLATL